MSPRLRFLFVLLLASCALGCIRNPKLAANLPDTSPPAQGGSVVYQVGQLPDLA